MNFEKPKTGICLSNDLWYWSQITLSKIGKQKSARLRLLSHSHNVWLIIQSAQSGGVSCLDFEMFWMLKFAELLLKSNDPLLLFVSHIKPHWKLSHCSALSLLYVDIGNALKWDKREMFPGFKFFKSLKHWNIHLCYVERRSILKSGPNLSCFLQSTAGWQIGLIIYILDVFRQGTQGLTYEKNL